MVAGEWEDKLAIRETLERYMRYNDDGALDRLRKNDEGQWVFVHRTGVSLARPGEAGTDSEWQRALARTNQTKQEHHGTES